MVRKATIDELGILEDLYNHRMLTVKQIRSLFFKGREGYVYSKLHHMKRAGDVEASAHVFDGQKKDACYVITEQGIRRLEEAGRITNPRRAYDNKPNPSQLPYIIKINDIHSVFNSLDFTLINARKWKQKHGLNRNALVQAGLKFPNQKEYAIYYFHGEISDKLWKRVCKEIEVYWQSRRFLFLFNTEKSYVSIKDRFHELPARYVDEMLLLPYPIFLFHPKLFLPESIQSFINENLGDTVQASNDKYPPPFSTFDIVDQHGEVFYGVNYLMCNETAIQLLKLKYPTSVYDYVKKRVCILAPDFVGGYLTELFKNFEHVKVIFFSAEKFIQYRM